MTPERRRLRLPLAQVNPLQARRFAQACGRRAKTDAIDAGMLAKMGAAFELRPTALPSLQQRQLRKLQLGRWSRVQERTGIRNRLPNIQSALLRRQARNRLRQVEREREALEAEIVERIQADAELARIDRILTSIPSVSRTTSATLLAELPEIGTLESRQVASLAGVAPMTRESGSWKGQSSLRVGAHGCAVGSTWRLWRQHGTIRTSRPNTRNSGKLESQEKWR